MEIPRLAYKGSQKHIKQFGMSAFFLFKFGSKYN